MRAIRHLGRSPFGWADRLRHRRSPILDHARLRWYRDATWAYRLTARCVVPSFLWPLARVTVDGQEHIPRRGPVILAANHRDNLDAYLLLHVVPRTVNVAARPDAFGTGGLCALWRRLGAFPADAWGMRHALTVLADGGAVVIFPQAVISGELQMASGAVGLLALRSGAPVVPVAIVGTDAVRATCPFQRRALISVRFGPPLKFVRDGAGSPRSLAVADEILRRIGTLLDVQQ